MKKKGVYIKPVISVTIIEIECGIANSSASVLVNDNNMDVFEDWTQDADDSRIIDWM